jgi:hypothetical protein
MKFDIEFTIRTKPVGARSEMVESATLHVESGTYKEALERTFQALKTCNTFQQFMDKISMDTVKYETTS